jgi:hypothetical protein
MKTGVILFERGREAAAEMTEVFEDLVAEARAELDQSRPEASSGDSQVPAAAVAAHSVESESEGSPP